MTPAHKSLDIETTGNAPVPTVEENGYFRVHRWRADFSPPAPNEPMSVPVTEYLPSVRVGWGIDLERALFQLSARVEETTPIDPRIHRMAEKIVEDIPKAQHLKRAQRLHAWILENVQDGDENDGRRVVVGKKGNRWRGFIALCRSLGIQTEWGIARNRLAPAPQGPLEEAKQYNQTALRVGGKSGRWTTISDKFSPFGYLPAAIRGMKAYVLGTEGTRSVVLPDNGAKDGVSFSAKGRLLKDGSVELDLKNTYQGAFAAQLRKGLDEVADNRLRDILESKLLGSSLPGARLLSHELRNASTVTEPLVIVMKTEAANFAVPSGSGVYRITPPFGVSLAGLAALPERQTAMLFATERVQKAEVELLLPEGYTAEVSAPVTLEFERFRIQVEDRAEGNRLLLKRSMVLPATRVPAEQYAEFVSFARAADAALLRQIVVRPSAQ